MKCAEMISYGYVFEKNKEIFKKLLQVMTLQKNLLVIETFFQLDVLLNWKK
jgi:hypothetical protein